jgi:hypothetical protein
MSYIFMDESGCLGFDFSKKGTSDYFIVTFLCTPHKRPIEKIVRRIFEGMSKAERNRLGGSLHSSKASPRTRMKLLHQLHKKEDAVIMLVRLNKRKVYTKLHDEKHVLYNYVTNILLDRIFSKKLVPLDETVHLVASRRETNRFLNDNFKGYLSKQITRNHQCKITVSILPPSAEKGLQVVDFASWAAFRKYEHGDASYLDIIKQLIIEDNTLFGG